MKNLFLLLAIGAFSFGVSAQVEKTRESSKLKGKKVQKLPKEAAKAKPAEVRSVKKEQVRTLKVTKVEKSKSNLTPKKQQVEMKTPKKNENIQKKTPQKSRGLTQEKVNHAEEKSNGNAFSGKGQEKVKKEKKSKVDKRNK